MILIFMCGYYLSEIFVSEIALIFANFVNKEIPNPICNLIKLLLIIMIIILRRRKELLV